MPELEIHYPDGIVVYKTVDKDRSVVIGSDADCDIQITGDDIQPRHCLVRWLRDDYQVESAGGGAPVTINGRTVKNAPFQNNDELQVGGYRFIMQWTADEMSSLDDDFDLDADDDQSPAPTRTAARPAPAPIVVEETYYTPMWRSHLFQIIAAGLAVVAVLGIILYVVVQQRAAEKQFDAAMADLSQGMFVQAVKRFDKFLLEYPDSEFVDRAKVWRGVAEVRQFSEGSQPNYDHALTASKTLVEKCDKLGFFRERGKEISDLILGVARGLAVTAKDKSDPAALEQSRAALLLAEDSFGGSQIDMERVEQVTTLQADAQRAIEKEKLRQESIARMRQALTNNDPMAVYAEHRGLYQRFDDLRGDKECQTLRQQARELEQRQIAFEELPAAEKLPPRTHYPSQAQFERETDAAAAATGKGVAVLVGDCLYGLDAGSGEVLWRRVIGLSPAFAPLAVDNPAGHLLVHEPLDNSLSLIDNATGEQKWRIPLPTDLRYGTPAIVHGDIAYLVADSGSDRGGQLLAVRLDRGDLSGAYRFPQAIAAAPAIIGDRDSLLVAGEAASLYSLAIFEQRCDGVIGFDHEPGTLQSAPAAAGRFLFLVQNQGNGPSRLHCLVLAPDAVAATPRQQVELAGSVWYAPVVVGGRLFLTTDKDHFSVYDLGGEEDPRPLTVGLRSLPTFESGTEQPFLYAASEREVWTAGRKLRAFSIDVENDNVEMPLEQDLPGAATQPPLRVGDGVIVTAVDPDRGTVTALAIDAKTRTQRWKTTLGQMPSAVRVDGDALVVVSGSSNQRISQDNLATDAVTERPRGSEGADRGRRTLEPLGNWSTGVLQWGGIGSDELYYVPAEGNALRVPLTARFSARPTAFGQGLLVPCENGFLYWIDPTNGKELADPFSSPYAQGAPLPIGAAAAIDDANAFVVLADQIVRLELLSDPSPYFRIARRGRIADPPLDGLVAVGNALVGIRGDQLVAVSPTDLTVINQWPLEGKVVGAAHVAGNTAVWRTDRGQLFCVQATDVIKPLWNTTLRETMAGDPIFTDDSVWFATANGYLVELSRGDGTERRKIDVGRSIVAGPWPIGDRLVLLAPDASLVGVPTAAKEESP